MPKIKVISKREWMMSRYDMKVYLDGQIMGYLPLGTRKEFDIPVGEHKLKAKMGFYRSKDFSITMFNKDIRSFTVSINRAGLVPIIFGILAILTTQIFAPESFKATQLFSGALSSLVVIFAGYFLLFGRNSFLLINELGKD